MVTAHMQPGVLVIKLRPNVLLLSALGLELLIVVPTFPSPMIEIVSQSMKPATEMFLVCVLRTELLAKIQSL